MSASVSSQGHFFNAKRFAIQPTQGEVKGGLMQNTCISRKNVGFPRKPSRVAAKIGTSRPCGLRVANARQLRIDTMRGERVLACRCALG